MCLESSGCTRIEIQHNVTHIRIRNAHIHSISCKLIKQWVNFFSYFPHMKQISYFLFVSWSQRTFYQQWDPFALHSLSRILILARSLPIQFWFPCSISMYSTRSISICMLHRRQCSEWIFKQIPMHPMMRIHYNVQCKLWVILVCPMMCWWWNEWVNGINFVLRVDMVPTCWQIQKSKFRLR